jgi:hypothetical protein
MKKIILLLILFYFFIIKCNKIYGGYKKILNIYNINQYFTIKNKLKNNKNKLIISCCFYLNKIHTPNNKYINGIKYLYKWTNKNNYILRIYYDTSVDYYINTLFTNKKDIELFKYYFPEYFDKNNNKHFGNFGMFMRFLPLFDIPKHYHKNILITDIDLINDKDISDLSIYYDIILNKQKLYNNDIILLSKYLYNFRNRIPNNNKYANVACCIYKNKNVIFNNTLFFNFFNKYMVNNNTVKPFKNIFQYGSDEYFLNISIFNDKVLKNLNHFKIIFFEKKIKKELTSKIKKYNYLIKDINKININNIDIINNNYIIDKLYQKYKNNCKNKLLLKYIIINNIFIKKYTYFININNKTIIYE